MDYANSVELLGYYGSDETHALSAWTSTSRDLTDDRKNRIGNMLSTLASAGHHTPFEKSTLHFLVTCDTASHIHALKHRVGVSINGESARYKEHTEDKFYIPADWPESEQEILRLACEDAYKNYHIAIDGLVARGFSRKRAKESARLFLPYASQLTLDISFNFRSFMHFQNLRNKDDAQLEIQEIAQAMLELVAYTGAFDLSLKAFNFSPSGDRLTP